MERGRRESHMGTAVRGTTVRGEVYLRGSLYKAGTD